MPNEESPVLHYAPRRRDVHSGWSVASVLLAGSAVFMLVTVGLLGTALGAPGLPGSPDWLKRAAFLVVISAAASCSAGMMAGVLGLIQKGKRRDLGAYGLFANGCILMAIAGIG